MTPFGWSLTIALVVSAYLIASLVYVVRVDLRARWTMPAVFAALAAVVLFTGCAPSAVVAGVESANNAREVEDDAAAVLRPSCIEPRATAAPEQAAKLDETCDAKIETYGKLWTARRKLRGLLLRCRANKAACDRDAIQAAALAVDEKVGAVLDALPELSGSPDPSRER